MHFFPHAVAEIPEIHKSLAYMQKAYLALELVLILKNQKVAATPSEALC